MEEFTRWTPASDSFFRLRGIFAFDLDETLTCEGRLPSRVLEALESLQKKCVRTVIVTGRPAGWADSFIKLFPVDAVLAENGACIFYRKNPDHKIAPRRLYWQNGVYTDKGSEQIAAKDPRFEKIYQEVKARFPRVQIAADQFARLYDLAIDFAEFVQPPMPFSEADEIRKIYEKHGAVAKVSSIHVNGWFGSFSKFAALEYLVQEVWRLNLLQSTVYFGDSPNDASLFEKLPLSVGVRNIEDFKDLNFTRPKYITDSREGDGVVEVIRHFLDS